MEAFYFLKNYKHIAQDGTELRCVVRRKGERATVTKLWHRETKEVPWKGVKVHTNSRNYWPELRWHILENELLQHIDSRRVTLEQHM